MRNASIWDLERIVEIYNSTVAARSSTADTVPVSVQSKVEWFQSHTPGVRPLLVHEEEGEVAAWMSFEPFYGRPAYQKTAEISIYVGESHRGKGLGRKLVQEALDMTQSLGINALVAFIFSHNEPSLRLFRSFGFEEWGMLPDVAEMDGKKYSLSILGKHLRS